MPPGTRPGFPEKSPVSQKTKIPARKAKRIVFVEKVFSGESSRALP
jgi:hypothetical protein